MADINDTNNTSGKLANEWDSLEAADIDDRDREAIREFIWHRRDIDDVAANTLISDMGTLRRASDRADRPLVEMEFGHVRRFLRRLVAPKDEGGYGLKADGGGIFGYKRGLRVFYNWLDEEPEFGEFDFGERIELPSTDYQEDTIDPEDLLTESEIEELKNAAKNPRDRALIDFLADVGARISLATSLRVGDVEGIDTTRPYFSPNMDALGLKGVKDKEYPILYSRAEMREWVNRNHPDPHPDAPLFPVRRGYDPENREQGAVSGDSVRDRLSDISMWAEIDKDVTPHHFRHVFMTRIANSDLSDRELKHISMLTDQQKRMLEYYDHTSDSERNEGIFEEFGFVDPDAETEEGEPKLTLIECYNCHDKVKSTAHFCPRCSVALKDELRGAVEEVQEASFDYAVDEDNPRKRRTARDIAKVARDDPDFAEELVAELQRMND